MHFVSLIAPPRPPNYLQQQQPAHMKHHFRPWVLKNAQLISALHRFGLNAFQQAVWAGTSSEACRIKATLGNASAIAKAKLRTGSSKAYVITMRDLLQTYDTYHLSCKIFWNDLKSSEQLLWFSPSSLNSEADAFEDQLADLMPETPVAIETLAALLLLLLMLLCFIPLHAAILGHTSKKMASSEDICHYWPSACARWMIWASPPNCVSTPSCCCQMFQAQCLRVNLTAVK